MHQKISELRSLLSEQESRRNTIPHGKALIIHAFLASPGKSWREHLQVILCLKDGKLIAFLNSSYTSLWKPRPRNLHGIQSDSDWKGDLAAKVQKRIEAMSKRSLAPEDKISVSFGGTSLEDIDSIAKIQDLRVSYRLTFKKISRNVHFV